MHNFSGTRNTVSVHVMCAVINVYAIFGGLYMLCNKTFKAFLEDQITKNKPIYSKSKSFLDIVIFFLQYLLSTSLVATHYFKSFITLFKKKNVIGI